MVSDAPRAASQYPISADVTGLSTERIASSRSFTSSASNGGSSSRGAAAAGTGAGAGAAAGAAAGCHGLGSAPPGDSGAAAVELAAPGRRDSLRASIIGSCISEYLRERGGE